MQKNITSLSLLALPLFLCALSSCDDDGSGGSTTDAALGASSDGATADTLASDGALTVDAPMSPSDAAPAGDGGTASDGNATDASPLPVASPGCTWKPAVMCDTGGDISAFCPGQRVARMQRCNETLFTPDLNYLSYHLCSCAGGQPDTCCQGVSWKAVECCPLPN